MEVVILEMEHLKNDKYEQAESKKGQFRKETNWKMTTRQIKNLKKVNSEQGNLKQDNFKQ